MNLDTFCKMLECDTARISKFPKRMFLIIGWQRKSEGRWLRNGVPQTFEYVEEKVVASGKTEEELLTSAKEYKRLLELDKVI